jgi:DNA invertase Pin-like site-specific DNA recombinase
MVIPARRQVGNTVKKSEQPKLRVAAYCRVSTDSDEQETSYDAQVTHYTEYIQKNPEWELAGIFADDGISGTNTKKRTEFKRMIDECMAGNIDMIITKSISRFARNTLDCLQYIRQLKDKNIPVYFEKESINTMDAKGEVLITIMASLAQQESQSLSQNVKLGLQYRYQQGKVQVNYNRFLGYTKDKDGHLVIDPEQAEIVKRIYREYLEGSSMDKIAAGLKLTAFSPVRERKMAHQHHQQDSPKREVHGRRPAAKDLYHRLPYKEADQEQRHRPSILCGGRP